jgi:hypothetical protein
MSITSDPHEGTQALPTDALRAGRRVPRLRLGAVAQRRLVTWCPPVFVALLFLPFLLRENVWWEWNNAYWMLERQTAYIEAHGLPTFFLQNSQGVFYAMPVYYGGFIFSVLALPAIVFGTWPTFVAATAGAYVAGYLGIWWTGRNLGLSRAAAVLPAAIFSCAPYMVATFYGRGAWAEVVAINAVAVVLGALTSLLWHPERRLRGAMAALVAATAVVAGTHNLTILLSAVVLPIVVLLLLPLRPPGLGARSLVRRLGWAVGGVLLGAGLTAAWLLPNLWFGRQTALGGTHMNREMLINYEAFSDPGLVLSPLPKVPEAAAGNYNYPQLAILCAAWTLVAGVLLLFLGRRPRGRHLVTVAGLLALAGGLLLAVVRWSWWTHAPSLILTIQLPVRLVPYVSIAVACACAAVLLGLRSGRARTVLVGTLVVLVGVQAAIAASVVLHSESFSTLGLLAPKHEQIPVESEPPSFSGPGLITPIQFRVSGKPTASPTRRDPIEIGFRSPITSIDGTMSGKGKVGDRRLTPVDWSPYVAIDGDVTLIGRDSFGMSVIRVDHVDSDGDWHATARPICTGLCVGAGLRGDAPWQLPVGRVIALLSTLIAAGFVLLWSFQGVRDWRRRRRDVAVQAT